MIDEESVRSLLSPGDIIPNFKTLCEMFKVTYYVKSSNPGKGIIKKLQQYCNFEFKGQKIIIIEIYDETKPIVDGRVENGNKIFIPYIEIVLSSYLASIKTNKLYITANSLYEVLGFYNSHFYDGYTSEELKVEEDSLRSFYVRSMGQFNKVLSRALNNMSNRALIEYSIERIIVLPNGDSFVANDQQTKAVLKIENDILNQMGLYDKRIVALRNMTKEYKRNIHDKLMKFHGWDYSYQRIKIIAVDSFRLLRDVDRNLARLQLNQKMMELINKNALSEFKANLKQYNEGRTKHMFSHEYLEQQYHLSRCLLSLDPKDEQYLIDTLKTPSDWDIFS